MTEHRRDEMRAQQAKEKLKAALDTGLQEKIESVRAIEGAVPPISRAEIINRIKTLAQEFYKAYRLTESAKITPEENKKLEDKRSDALHSLDDLVNKSILPAEVRDFFVAYFGYLELKEELPEGMIGEFFEAAYQKMKTASESTTWDELKEAFSQINIEYEEISAKRKSTETDISTDRSITLSSMLVSKKIDFDKLTNPGNGLKLFSIDDFEDFQRKLSYSARLVDQKRPLRPEQESYYKDIIDRLEDDAVVFVSVSNGEILKQIRNLQAFIKELLARSVSGEMEKLSWDEEDYLQGFIPPEMKVPESETDEQRDRRERVKQELQKFLSQVGTAEIDEAQRVALRMAKAESPSEVVKAEELAKLKKLKDKFEKLINKYYRFFFADPEQMMDGDRWNEVVDLDRQVGSYIGWLQFLIDIVERPSKDDYKKRAEAEEPELEGTREKWESFFLAIGRGPNGYERLSDWGGTIMDAFYPDTEPVESHKSRLETKRFGAWRAALRKISDEVNAVPGEPDKKKPKYIKDARSPIGYRISEDYDARWEVLSNTYDNQRLITDAMITFAQSREMTADWHSDEMVAKLGAESQSQHSFKPETIDFFTLTTEEALEIEKADKDKKKFPFDPEVIERHYPHAVEMRQTLTMIKSRLNDPNSPYYRKRWKPDDSSRNALKSELVSTLTRIMSLRPEGRRLSKVEIKSLVETAYNIACFGGLRLDTFAESYIAGDSPAGAISKRKGYFEEACPPTGYLYSAYDYPKFLPELEIVYKPEDLIETWKAKYIDLQSSDDDIIDFAKRIYTIEQAIRGTQLVLEEEAPLRTEDKKEPFGYVLERYDYDGMMKWQYPSLYRFLTDPELQRRRITMGLTFEMWAEGFKAFKDYRKQAHANLDCHGKSPDEAIEFLTNQLRELVNKVSALKTNMLIDWNYINALMVMFVDRMYRAFNHVEMNDLTREVKRAELYRQVTQIFGLESMQAKVASRFLDMFDPHAPKIHIPEARRDAINADKISIGSNKLNTAGKVDLFRTFPPGTKPETKRRRYQRLVNEKLDQMERDAVEKGETFNRDEEEEKLRTLELPFARVMIMQTAGVTYADKARRQGVYRAIPDPNWIAFKRKYPGFERTVAIMGQSTEEQKKTADEQKKK